MSVHGQGEPSLERSPTSVVTPGSTCPSQLVQFAPADLLSRLTQPSSSIQRTKPCAGVKPVRTTIARQSQAKMRLGRESDTVGTVLVSALPTQALERADQGEPRTASVSAVKAVFLVADDAEYSPWRGPRRPRWAAWACWWARRVRCGRDAPRGKNDISRSRTTETPKAPGEVPKLENSASAGQNSYLAKYFVPRLCPVVLSFFASIMRMIGSWRSFFSTPSAFLICSTDWPGFLAT